MSRLKYVLGLVAALLGYILFAQDDQFELFVNNFVEKIPEVYCGIDEIRACLDIDEVTCKSILNQNINNCRSEIDIAMSSLYNVPLESFPENPSSINNLSNIQICAIEQLVDELSLDQAEVDQCMDEPP